SASSTPATKSRGVVSVLAAPMRPLVSSTTATSVNVPPMSTPIRQVMTEYPLPVHRLSSAKSRRAPGKRYRPHCLLGRFPAGWNRVRFHPAGNAHLDIAGLDGAHSA